MCKYLYYTGTDIVIGTFLSRIVWPDWSHGDGPRTFT